VYFAASLEAGFPYTTLPTNKVSQVSDTEKSLDRRYANQIETDTPLPMSLYPFSDPPGRGLRQGSCYEQVETYYGFYWKSTRCVHGISIGRRGRSGLSADVKPVLEMAPVEIRAIRQAC
jgi:hypothetical protein